MDFNGKLLISDDGKSTFVYEEPKGCILFFFRKTKTYTVTIDPNTRMVTAEERKIPFAEINKVETFFIHEQPSMEVVGFHIVLKTNEKIRLGGDMISRQGNAARPNASTSQKHAGLTQTVSLPMQYVTWRIE